MSGKEEDKTSQYVKERGREGRRLRRRQKAMAISSNGSGVTEASLSMLSLPPLIYSVKKLCLMWAEGRKADMCEEK